MIARTKPQQRKEEWEGLAPSPISLHFLFILFNELCLGKAMMAYSKPQQGMRGSKKEGVKEGELSGSNGTRVLQHLVRGAILSHGILRSKINKLDLVSLSS